MTTLEQLIANTNYDCSRYAAKISRIIAMKAGYSINAYTIRLINKFMSYLLHKVKFFNINKNTLDFPLIWNDIIVFNKIYGRNFIMYKIGEFAKLCNCSTKLIRFYDDIGLLKADYVDADSGYRYYNTNQKEIFQKIILFREVGFTLKEITRELLFSSGEDVLAALEKKEKELLNKYELCCKLKENYKEFETMDERVRFIKSAQNDSINAEGALELFTDEQNIDRVLDVLNRTINIPGYINVDIWDIISMAKSNNAYSVNYNQLKMSGEYNNIPISENPAKCGIVSLVASPETNLDNIDRAMKNIVRSFFQKGLDFHEDKGIYKDTEIVLGISFDDALRGTEIEASVIELY